MPFDYDRNESQASDGFWTSYSDLFLGLSTIFLLLYVFASLRTGTDSIKSQVENQKLSMRVEELQNQLKMYEAVKTNYLEKEASKSEAQEYQELMDKLTLLQADTKAENENLTRQVQENQKKETALNKYQQLVRNIINANKMGKAKLIARNDLIGEQDTTISEQKKNIQELDSEVEAKKKKILETEENIRLVQRDLELNKKKLRYAYKSNKITHKVYQSKMLSLESQNERKLQDLKKINTSYVQQLNELSTELRGTQSQLAQKDQETQELESKIASIKQNFEIERAKAKAAYEAELQKGKFDAAERGRREAAFRKASEEREKAMQGNIAGLANRLKDTEKALSKAKEEMDARREIAKEIRKGFAAVGVKANVDEKTGEVVLDFGNTYFDNNSAELKLAMKTVIEKAMPVYSRSLFGNPKVANKISSVEIVGFASPTYKGRYIDPKSSKPEDKAALKYNMNLSYQRANSIFNYLLEGRMNNSAESKTLLSLMKVSGRSFLDIMNVKTRGPASAADFCKVNECKKAQRVIIRFSMDGKTGETKEEAHQ